MWAPARCARQEQAGELFSCLSDIAQLWEMLRPYDVLETMSMSSRPSVKKYCVMELAWHLLLHLHPHLHESYSTPLASAEWPMRQVCVMPFAPSLEFMQKQPQDVRWLEWKRYQQSPSGLPEATP